MEWFQYGRFLLNNNDIFCFFFKYKKVFVLMQFDPGLEYQPNRGDHGREGNSWLLLCSALTDGPYSYIWNNNNNNSESTSHPITERSKKKNADGVRFDWPLQLSFEYHPISLSPVFVWVGNSTS